MSAWCTKCDLSEAWQVPCSGGGDGTTEQAVCGVKQRFTASNKWSANVNEQHNQQHGGNVCEQESKNKHNWDEQLHALVWCFSTATHSVPQVIDHLNTTKGFAATLPMDTQLADNAVKQPSK